MEDNSISFLKSYKFYGEFEIKGCEINILGILYIHLKRVLFGFNR